MQAKELEVVTNRPQSKFLSMPHKYRAYVAGYGCVHPDTRIWTERGLMRIADISSPIHVLSWCEKSQKFQLSLSGGAFPKGRANLLRVTTSQGEFAATSHHQIFSSGSMYRPLGEVAAGMEVLSASLDLLSTISESGRLLFPVGAGHSRQKAVNSMGRYADEARLYGQRFLTSRDSVQSSAPSRDGAQGLPRFFCPSAFLRMGAHAGQRLAHIRRGLFCARKNMSHSARHTQSRAFVAEGQTLAQLLGRIFAALQGFPLFASKFSRRHTAPQPQIASHSYEPPVPVEVLNIQDTGEECEYYDMQVLDTNNYVDEFGHIHHNSGKTFVGSMAQCAQFWELPKVNQGYFAPTYPQIRDIFYPTIEEVAHLMGLRVEVREGNKEVHFYNGRTYRGTTICRSMERPETIVGFKIGRAMVDELDVMKPDKAQAAWNKIIGRMRYQDAPNGIDVTTTPEGFRFVYQRFKEAPTESYGLIQASTYDNRQNLPADYIPSLLESYPAELIDAYLNGQFVNLTSGTVYSSYSRTEHRSTESIKEKELLRIGMDFNVTNMSAVVYVVRGKQWHAVDELKGIYDTPAMIDTIKERYPQHPIRVYPDASGGSRKTVDASVSDISLLEAAGFAVYANKRNPAVKDRVISTNMAFQNGLLYINDTKCPEYAKCMEQLAYDKNGEPDKSSNLDHLPDAGTYPIAFEMPVEKPAFDLPMRFSY